MTVPHRITEMFAWVLSPSDGDDGVPAITHGAMWLPLVGSDRARIESFRVVAENLVRERPGTLTLRRFSNMEILETVKRE